MRDPSKLVSASDTTVIDSVGLYPVGLRVVGKMQGDSVVDVQNAPIDSFFIVRLTLRRPYDIEVWIHRDKGTAKVQRTHKPH